MQLGDHSSVGRSRKIPKEPVFVVSCNIFCLPTGGLAQRREPHGVRPAIHGFALDESSFGQRRDERGHIGAKNSQCLSCGALSDTGIGRNHEQNRGVCGFELQGCQGLGEIRHRQNREPTKVIPQHIVKRVGLRRAAYCCFHKCY